MKHCVFVCIYVVHMCVCQYRCTKGRTQAPSSHSEIVHSTTTTTTTPHSTTTTITTTTPNSKNTIYYGKYNIIHYRKDNIIQIHFGDMLLLLKRQGEVVPFVTHYATYKN